MPSTSACDFGLLATASAAEIIWLPVMIMPYPLTTSLVESNEATQVLASAMSAFNSGITTAL